MPVSPWCQPPRFAARVAVGGQTQQLDVIGGVDVLQFRSSAHIRRCLPLPGSVRCCRSNNHVIVSGETRRKQQTHPLVYYGVLRYLSCCCGRIVWERHTLTQFILHSCWMCNSYWSDLKLIILSFLHMLENYCSCSHIRNFFVWIWQPVDGKIPL